MKRILISAVVVASAVATNVDTASAARTFQNCTALQQVYPHGVGRAGARDRTSGKPVTTFKRSTALYNANRKSDRDGDGVACEKA